MGSIVDWTEFFSHAFTSLKPGGYLESFEPSPVMESDDGTIKDSDAMGQWGKLFIEGGNKIGRSCTAALDGTIRRAMEEAGFVDIEERDINVCLPASNQHSNLINSYYYPRPPSALGPKTRPKRRSANTPAPSSRQMSRDTSSSWQPRWGGLGRRFWYTSPNSSASAGTTRNMGTTARRLSGVRSLNEMCGACGLCVG